MSINSLATVPADILLEIAAHLETQSDLVRLSFVSKNLYESVVLALYANVTLVGVKQCIITLEMLNRRPDIARHVQKLVIHPHGQRKGRKLRDACIIAAAVRHIVFRLDALNTFIWVGEDMCPYDDMWFALRMLCPQLRVVGATLGSLTSGIHGHLFDFSGLTGFSIRLRPRFYHDHIDQFADEHLPTYRKFWDMLIKRCPDLEELSVSGTYCSPGDAAMLITGRWQKLRRLFLGDVVCDWLIASPQDMSSRHPFVEFLEAHAAIETISISRHTISPGHLSTLGPSALPNVTDFEGTFDQLKALPFMHGSLKMVKFRDPMPTRELVPLSVASTLQGLCSLIDLRIVFVVHSMYDSGGLLRSLVLSCPRLRHLDLTLAQKPSLRVDSFAKTVRALTKLETLSLSLVRCFGEESLLTGASRIARANPGLRTFQLTFLPPFFPLPLPFALPLPLPPPFALPPIEESGTYTVHHNALGMPVSLAAYERRDRFWPLGLYVSRSASQCTIDLRVPVGGTPGIVALMLDGGRAGEELRVLMLCAVLMALSIFGFVRGLHRSEVLPLGLV